MKLVDAAKQYTKCMSQDYGCLVENCPLRGKMRLEIGVSDDEDGGMTWRIEGCALMTRFEDFLKNKKPGKKEG